MPTDLNIFRAYDIRGTYPEQLDEKTAYDLGGAYAKLISEETKNAKPSIVVSHDMRQSSPQLYQSLINGLTDNGVSVVAIGLASTPTMYFATAFYCYHGGIQVSASHNPANHNGFKLVRSRGIPISENNGIMTLRDWVGKKIRRENVGKGESIEKQGVLKDLVTEQTKNNNLGAIKPFKIVIDAANAMGSVDLLPLFNKLPCQVEKVNFELDGSFPSHEADPLKSENLQLLKEKVLASKADFGIAPDGDNDRVFIVMENGETLPPEVLRGILAQIVLKREPHSPIGYDVRPGKATIDMILEAGGKPFITKVGHSLIKEEMLKHDSPFSGESSGHYFYRFDYGSFEAPIKMLVDFMLWLSQKNQPLSLVVKPYQKYFHSGEINSTVEDKNKVFEGLKKRFHNAKNFSDLDGVTFGYNDFWFNVRASNTEPKVRLNLEAISKQVMENKRDEVLAIIRQ